MTFLLMVLVRVGNFVLFTTESPASTIVWDM